MRGVCTPSRTHCLYQPAGHSSNLEPVTVWGVSGLYFSRGRRLYRARGTPFRPLFECEGLVPPPASVVLYRPRGTLVSVYRLQSRECVGPVSATARVVYTDPWDGHPRAQYTAVYAGLACDASRGCRLYRPRGTPFQQLLECVGPVLLSACAVCTDLTARSFQFITCSRVSA